MHALDVLKYGNLTVLKTIQKLPPDDWNTAGVCGWWSVREIVAHLASFEYILIEVLNVAGGMRPSHFLIDMLHNGQAFNDTQVAALPNPGRTRGCAPTSADFNPPLPHET